MQQQPTLEETVFEYSFSLHGEEEALSLRGSLYELRDDVTLAIRQAPPGDLMLNRYMVQLSALDRLILALEANSI